MSNAASTPEFKKILTGLYSGYPHWKSGEVLREAWKEYKSRHGQLGPSGSVQRKRYAMRKTAEGMNPKRKFFFVGEGFGYTAKIGGYETGPFKSFHKAENALARMRRQGVKGKSQIVSRKLSGSEENPRKKNPIAVYNPSKRQLAAQKSWIKSSNPKGRLTKLPATQIEMRYKRTTGKYAGKFFKHSFKSGAALFGMPDGSLLLKSSTGRKLWGTA